MIDPAVGLRALPFLVGEGSLEDGEDGMYFNVNTVGTNEKVDVVYDQDGQTLTPYLVRMLRWNAEGILLSDIFVGEYTEDWQAAEAVKGALLAARSRDERPGQWGDPDA